MKPKYFDIVYEDNHLLVVNKPAGLLVQGDESGDINLVDAAKLYLKEAYLKEGNVFCGLVHRLDRPVSGIVILAKTSKALARMNELFRDRKIEKVYRALVAGKPEPINGILEHWLVKDTKINKAKFFLKEVKNSQKARLNYTTLETRKDFSLLEVRLETGRFHQIRCQLSAIGCPIVGDKKYGSSYYLEQGKIALHAFLIKFEHPIKKEILTLSVPIPDSLIWNP